MKTITTLTAVAALIAGLSIASAQNQGGTAAPGASPSNINKGADDGKGTSQSGSESSGTAMKPSMAKTGRVEGTGKYCIEISAGGGIQCKFATLEACTKEAQPNHRQCSPNANLGTTGSK